MTARDTGDVSSGVRLTYSNGVLIAILDQAFNVQVTETLLDDTGGDATMTFNMPINDPKAALIKNEMTLRVTRVTADPTDPYQTVAIDDRYIVRDMVAGYDDSGTKQWNCYAEALWYDLSTDDLITVSPSVGTATAAMNAILLGTTWTVGTVSVPAPVGSVAWGSTDLITPLAALRSLPAVFGGELVFDTINLKVSLVPRRGDQTPRLAYVRGGNLSHDIRTISTRNLVTRLHPLGANNIDITSVNNNVPWIEDNSYFDTNGIQRKIRAQALTNDQISDPAALLAWARNQLTTLAQPTYTYDLGVTLLTGQKGVIPAPGDLVRVVDDSIGLDTYARVAQRVLDVVEPWRTVLSLDTAPYTLATPTVGGGTGLSTGTVTGTDTTIPNGPTNLALTFGSGLDPNGNWNSYGVATWTAPTTNTDGTPISDFDHYNIEVLIPDVGVFTPVGAIADVTAGFGYVPANEVVQVRVQAVDHSGNRSAWTTQSALVPLPTPFYEPPSIPALDVDTLPLTIGITWDGLDDHGVPYPADVDSIEIHAKVGAGAFTPDDTTLRRTVPAVEGGFTEPLTGLDPALVYTIALEAVGRLATHSLPSVEVAGQVQPVGPTHLVYNGDQDNIIPDGSFETPAGQARLLNDPTWSSVWSFVTTATAPITGAVAHGLYALLGRGANLAGQARQLNLVTSTAQDGQKVWVKAKYRNTTTGGTCYLACWCYDAAGVLIGQPQIALPPNSAYATTSFVATLPAGTATFSVLVLMDQSVATGYLLLDATECRTVVQTAIIDQLAVTDAQIASVSAGKITVGLLSANVVNGGLISTSSTALTGAPTGARVDIKATGVFAYNGAGTNTVAIRNDGTASFTGTITGSVFQTAATGHRVVIDSGVDPTQITFPTGTAGEVVYASIGTSATALYLYAPQDPAAPTVQAQMHLDKIGDIVLNSGRNVDIYHGSVGGNAITLHDNVAIVGNLTHGGHPYVYSPSSALTFIDGGSKTGTTDSTGFITVTHGLGATPVAVSVTGKSPTGGSPIPGTFIADTFTSTTFRVRVLDTSGAAFASTSLTFTWIAVG